MRASRIYGPRVLEAVLCLAVPFSASAVGNGSTAAQGGVDPEERFHQIQAQNGSAPERFFRERTAARKVVDQAIGSGSALDLTKRDITGATSIGGGGVLTKQNAAQMLEGAKAYTPYAASRVIMYEVRGGRLFGKTFAIPGVPLRDLGPVSEYLGGDGVHTGIGTYIVRVTSSGVEVMRRDLYEAKPGFVAFYPWE